MTNTDRGGLEEMREASHYWEHPRIRVYVDALLAETERLRAALQDEKVLVNEHFGYYEGAATELHALRSENERLQADRESADYWWEEVKSLRLEVEKLEISATEFSQKWKETAGALSILRASLAGIRAEMEQEIAIEPPSVLGGYRAGRNDMARQVVAKLAAHLEQE